MSYTGYTLAMKTAVSIPDDLFEAAEKAAKRRGSTRSGLYAEALASFLAREERRPRRFGIWVNQATLGDDDLVGSDPDILAMFEDS
jgi:predicted transcriptional regulator